MSGPRGPQCPLGKLQRSPMNVEVEKRNGWRRHGILVISEDDHRLTWPERELVRQLGMRLYGRHGRADHD